VEVGDRVEEDTTIGIIEVMKLMNPIRAGVAGTVVAVLAQNGVAVEEGQPLIRVKSGG
jgi:acetyl-CoA carboxylase biotin carboxyl carrier protein